MDEQAGLLYYVAEQFVAVPNTIEGLRLFRRLSDGKYYVKHSDDTIELFSSGTGGSTSLFEEINDVGNVGAGEDDLYINQIVAGTLFFNGDAVNAKYAVRLANTLNSKVIRFYLFGAKIFESTIDYSTGQLFDLNFELFIIRTSTSTAKSVVSYYGTGVDESQITDIAGLDFTINNAIRLTGEAVANNDIVAKFNKGIFVPKS